MSKKLRREPIYIAPEIIGWLDENHNHHVLDERMGRQLDPRDVIDKIEIYERQVKDWFLKPATALSKRKNSGFIVLMICLSYLEGIEQYRRGQNSDGNSKRFFVSAMERIYLNQFQNKQLKEFYTEARCGLFHSGMVKGRIIINNEFKISIEFVGNDIKISPSKLLEDIKKDFESYLQELRSNEQSRVGFDRMYSNL